MDDSGKWFVEAKWFLVAGHNK